MKATSANFSGMPTGKAYIGWWGDMGGPKQKGVVQYSLSHMQQKAFAGALKGYIFNGYSRIIRQVPYFLPAFGLGYFIYTWGNKTNAFNNSKAGHLAHGGSHDE